MQKNPLPEVERRGDAVRLACNILISTETKLLPPDPEHIARELGYPLVTVASMAKTIQENPDGFIRQTAGAEAFTLRIGEDQIIVYDDTIRSPERMRFSIFHETGHLVMDHFTSWDLMTLSVDEARVLEDEANTFARNLMCPPPILDLVRGEWEDPKWAALFCMSQRAWKARIRTMAIDRRYIDQHLADKVRNQFREYMFGRRCRECGEVFTDEFRTGKCPKCGRHCLAWNPQMEDRLQARAHQHIPGATAEDLRPRVGVDKELDLTRYWEKL